MILNKVKEIEEKLKDEFEKLDDICLFNSQKVLDAFIKERLSVSDFSSTTGYGYRDIGRDKIEKIYCDIFKCESALVRHQLISGTHALTVAFFGILRPGDVMLSITGLPYDSLHQVIGIKDNSSSLKSYGINFKYIDLLENDFDYDKFKISLDNVKVVHIQRSIGYGNRNTISIEKLEKVIKFIKDINNEIIILVDNCYCELCGKLEPTEVGADIVIGSLIKNLGGGIANNGGYIVGRKDLLDLCAERLTAPGIGFEIGPSLNQNRNFLLGLYMAPNAVKSALKVKLLTRELFNSYGYNLVNESLDDIVLGIIFNDEEKLIKYVVSIQNSSAVDSQFSPIKDDMPGYSNQIIMASGSFTDGSSIELSCDGPIREPYIAYQQGSLTYEYGKIAVINAISNVLKWRDR